MTTAAGLNFEDDEGGPPLFGPPLFTNFFEEDDVVVEEGNVCSVFVLLATKWLKLAFSVVVVLISRKNLFLIDKFFLFCFTYVGIYLMFICIINLF